MKETQSKIEQFQGKVVVITGAAGAIGEACAKLLLQKGANLMLLDWDETGLKAVSDKLNGGDRVAFSVLDTGDEAAVKLAVTKAVETFGGVDILLAYAGTEGPVKPLDMLSYDEFERVQRTNVTGVWLAMKHCIAPMKQRGGGSILVTSSIAGMVGYPGLSHYVTSKHAICGLVKSAALELATSGIRVNAIAPGPVDNRMMRSVESQALPDNPSAVQDMISGIIPMKRYGTNEEVAQITAFLVSDAASYCTGGIYPVDGGFTAA